MLWSHLPCRQRVSFPLCRQDPLERCIGCITMRTRRSPVVFLSRLTTFCGASFARYFRLPRLLPPLSRLPAALSRCPPFPFDILRLFRTSRNGRRLDPFAPTPGSPPTVPPRTAGVPKSSSRSHHRRRPTAKGPLMPGSQTLSCRRLTAMAGALAMARAAVTAPRRRSTPTERLRATPARRKGGTWRM